MLACGQRLPGLRIQSKSLHNTTAKQNIMILMFAVLL